LIEDYEHYQVVLYCTIFLVANSLFLVNYVREENFRLIFAILSAFIVGIIFGLRSNNIGLDSRNYADFFDGVDLIQGSPGFSLIAIFFRFFFSDYSVFFVLVSIMSNLFMVIGLRFFSKNYLFVYGLLLTSFAFLNMNINIIRQGLAVSLVIFSTGLLVSHRYTSSLIVTFVAASIHPTAILMAANVFLINKPISMRSGFLLIAGISLLAIYSMLDLINALADMSEVIRRYVWYFYWDRVSPWRIKHVYYGIFSLIGLLFLFRSKISWEIHRVLMYVIYGVVLLLLFKSEEMVADRIFFYFIPIIPVLLYYAITRFNPNRYPIYVLVVLSNLWLLKTMFYQYPNWFIPPFESVRL